MPRPLSHLFALCTGTTWRTRLLGSSLVVGRRVGMKTNPRHSKGSRLLRKEAQGFHRAGEPDRHGSPGHSAEFAGTSCCPVGSLAEGELASLVNHLSGTTLAQILWMPADVPGPRSADIARFLPTPGNTLPKLDRLRSTSGQVPAKACLASANFDPILINIGQIRPESTKFGRCWAT